jgi:hypothetical protein
VPCRTRLRYAYGFLPCRGGMASHWCFSFWVAVDKGVREGEHLSAAPQVRTCGENSPVETSMCSERFRNGFGNPTVCPGLEGGGRELIGLVAASGR